MNLKERRRRDVLARVHAFGERCRRAFPPSTMGGKTFAEIRSIVAELSEHATRRMSCEQNVRSGTRQRGAARAALRVSLQSIHQTALALAIDTPGIDRGYRLPRSRGDRAWLDAARAFAMHAQESAHAFIAYGLPSAFLDALAAEVGCLEEAIRNGAAARNARASARVQVQQSLRRGLVALRRLDGIVPNVVRGDPATLRRWRSARRPLRSTKRRVKRGKTLRPAFRAA
jgi:hypothetical protein